MTFMTVEQLQAQIATLTAENERLREALEFYADPKNWKRVRFGASNEHSEPSPVSMRKYRKAAAALQPKEGKG